MLRQGMPGGEETLGMEKMSASLVDASFTIMRRFLSHTDCPVVQQIIEADADGDTCFTSLYQIEAVIKKAPNDTQHVRAARLVKSTLD